MSSRGVSPSPRPLLVHGQRTALKPSTETSYRHDLDGLRGIAIALVVIYHVFVGRVSGGVDVFLLLSGYFFFGSQLRYVLRPNASLNPWWPLWRTLRRLVPSLVVVLVATFLLSNRFAPYIITPDVGQQFSSALTYTLNWTLINQDAAYTAAAMTTSPLQHLWSMSVQGQFYLLAISTCLLLGWGVRRGSATATEVHGVVGPALILLTFISFLWASRFGWVGTEASYYSLFSRLWELTLGAALAIYLPRISFPARWSRPAVRLGLVLITLTGLLIPTSLAFPGPAALIPIGGALLIMLGGQFSSATRALTTPAALWLGRIAYPLYLWHWPLLIVSTAILDAETPPVWSGFAVIAASLLLADLTHRLIEEPLRQHRPRPTRESNPLFDARVSLRTPLGATRALGGVVILALAGWMYTVPVAMSARAAEEEPFNTEFYPGARVLLGVEAADMEPRPDPSIAAAIFPPPGHDGCLVFIPADADYIPKTNDEGDPCAYGDTEAERTVIITGGSHAETWSIPLDNLGQELGFKVIPILRQTCPIMIGDNEYVSEVCVEWSRHAVDYIIDLNPDLVISTSTRPKNEDGTGEDVVPKGYEGFWEMLADADIPFLGLRDNPWFFSPKGDLTDPNFCLMRHQSSGKGFIEDEDPVLACSMPIEQVYAKENPADGILAKYPLASSVDTSEWFCPEGLCSPVIGNVTVYRDQNHFSNAYANSLTEILRPHVVKALD